MSWDYQSSNVERNKHCNWCGYLLRFDQNLQWVVPTPSPIPRSIFSTFHAWWKVIYRATTMKSCTDTANASWCGGNIDPRHWRRIIAAAIGVGCEKEGGVDWVFPSWEDEEWGYKEWYQGMMESIEIKSKRNIRRKQYQKRLQWKKEMTPTLGFSFGRIYFKKEIFCNVFLIWNLILNF